MSGTKDRNRIKTIEKRYKRIMVIAVRISVPEYLELDEKCKRFGISMSDYIRAKATGRGPDSLSGLVPLLKTLLAELTKAER